MSNQRPAGFIAWVRTVKEEIRFMKVDFNKTYPDNISWADQVGDATVFSDSHQPKTYFEQLSADAPRRFMGKIFPPIALAVAMDMDSDTGEFEGWFGVSPFFFEPSMRDARRVVIETLDDPDPQFNASNEQKLRSLSEFVEFLAKEARRAGAGKKIVVTKADLFREFNPKATSGDARRVIEGLQLRPDIIVHHALVVFSGVRMEFEYKEGT